MAVDSYLSEVRARDWQELDGEADETLRLAMVGLGWWTRERALPAVEQSSFCETTVLVSSDIERAERVRDEVSARAALTYDEFRDGGATEAYDAVYVCTPNATHLQHVRAAANHGKAILCEKPVEATLERAETLVESAADVPLMVAYRMQTDPSVRRMRELVRDGAIGTPVSVHGHMAQPMLDVVSDAPDQWRLSPNLAGYGATVMDLGIYPLNTARFVLDADPVSVTAQMRSEHEAFGNVPDEHAAFTLTFDDGTYAACTASQNATLSGHLRIVGTDGELRLEPTFLGQTPQELLYRDGDGAEVAVDDGRRELLTGEMREEFDYFADRVIRGVEPSPNGEHALVDMRTLAAVYEAASSGERVELA